MAGLSDDDQAALNLAHLGAEARAMDKLASWMLGGGALAALLAVVAWFGDHRRARRRHIDAVGFMPWTDVFFWSTMLAVLLLGAGARAMFSA